jgi:hypothetical protein
MYTLVELFLFQMPLPPSVLQRQQFCFTAPRQRAAKHITRKACFFTSTRVRPEAWAACQHPNWQLPWDLAGNVGQNPKSVEADCFISQTLGV